MVKNCEIHTYDERPNCNCAQLHFRRLSRAGPTVNYQTDKDGEQIMATPREIDTMNEIEIIVNLWKSQQIPTWRAIEKIAAIILHFQKATWNENH